MCAFRMNLCERFWYHRGRVNFSYIIVLIDICSNHCCYCNVVKLQQFNTRAGLMAPTVR